ncbi:MAG TPA: nucleotide-binding protein [Steroidobacteraceae bacterium]
MNSSIDLVKRLRTEGERFTFENFSFPDSQGGHRFAGGDKPDWLAWKTRSINHGHDDALKTDIERFLREIGMDPVVLHRQPDKGKTIIEKFEAHSDVGYAFVLLTPDDMAYPRAEEHLPEERRHKEARARPNVIFEFGYFVGRLGRERVCCLYKEGVVVPSDLDGLIYKKIDGSIDSQGYALIKELKAAGYEIAV